jgi:hypothetical protein
MKNFKFRIFRKCCLSLLVLFLSSIVAAQDNGALNTYTDFLQKQNTTAKDYILSLFDKYDIVILCERDHREITQYDLILDVLRDERFTQNVKNVYSEIGNAKNNDMLDSFLHNPALTPEEVSQSVMNIHRNSYGAPLWEKANYSYYIEGVYNINKKLSPENQINIRGLDIGIDWKYATENDIRLRDSLVNHSRDSILALNFINYYKTQNTNKALVILNYRHALLKDLFGRENAGRFIADLYNGQVANIFINSFGLKRDDESVVVSAIQDGKWDASFIKAGKQDVGFNFADSPFGNDSFDIIPFPNNFNYSQMFTGFVYYTYFPDLRIVTGIKGLIDDEFAPELQKRYQLEQKVYNNEIPDMDTLKADYNTVEDKTYGELDDFTKAIEAINSRLNIVDSK